MGADKIKNETKEESLINWLGRLQKRIPELESGSNAFWTKQAIEGHQEQQEKKRKEQDFNQLRREVSKKERELLDSPDFKKCFTCNDIKPLAEFKVNHCKAQRPAHKGRNVNCIDCNK